MFNVRKLAKHFDENFKMIIDKKTKPIGALGQLEEIALQLANIFCDKNKRHISLNRPVMLVFAADHGIATQKLSIAPSEVTQQMVLNFINGGAAINCFCEVNDMALEVIDAGILMPLDDSSLVKQSLGRGTKNFVVQQAMSLEQVKQGLQFGKDVVVRNEKLGSNLFGFGEMGIGNTSSATSIQCLLMNIPIEKCVGRGTGITDTVLAKKEKLLTKACDFHRKRLGNKITDPLEIMSAVGGFEIVQMVGGMLEAAEKQKAILVDGYIATAAAMLAVTMEPNARDYMIFCHRSNENGHRAMLKKLKASPLLDLELRLGEGTGVALALPIIRASAKFFNDMASFESANVDDVVS